MRNRKLGILLALLVITVAFASVTTTLVLTGVLSIGSDTAGFDADVVFNSVTILGGEYTLSDNNKTLEFKTDYLNTLGSETTLSFEISNNSRQYDAQAVVECSSIDSVYDSYVSVDITPTGTFTLDALETESGTIKVKLTRSIAGEGSEIQFECKITAEALERDSLQTDASRFEGTDVDTVGSEICIEDECFNVVSSTDDTISMITQYNVNRDTYRQSTLASGIVYEEKAEEIMAGYLSHLYDITRAKDTTSITISLLTKESLTSTYGCAMDTSDVDTPVLSCLNSPYSSWLITNQEYYLLPSEDSVYESLDINGAVVSSNNGGIRPVVTISKTLLKETE